MSNKEDCYNEVERRGNCSALLVLTQRVNDEEKAREQWRSTMLDRLSKQDETLGEILKFTNKFKGPLTFGFWAGVIFITTIIVASAGLFIKSSGKIIKWFLG